MDSHNTLEFQLTYWFNKNGLIPNVNVMRVVSLVSEQTGIPVDRILGTGRTDIVVYARHLVYYLLFVELKYSPAQIAELLDVERKTVLHSVQQIVSWIDAHPYIILDLIAIKPQLKPIAA